MKRAGIANLPLHNGRAPSWLFNMMKKLAREICLVIVEEFGREEFLRRISDPVWFQSFGCVLGFDWHSSGLTTTTLGALKEGLKEINYEGGIYIAGGKGKRGLSTPEEIKLFAEKKGFNPEPLIYSSRITAKVDNVAIQDGYSIYQHFFIFDERGNWVVIQQGMNSYISMARRYHWFSEGLNSFIVEPHRGICGKKEGRVLNMVARESLNCQNYSIKLLEEKNEVLNTLKKIPQLNLPYHHQIFWKNTDRKRLKEVFISLSRKKIKDFENLLNVRGVGPKTVRAMALLCEIIYGVTPSYTDPVRYTFAHGGKDGHPFPVDKEVYVQSINMLTEVLRRCKIPPIQKERKLRKLAFLLKS